MPCRLQVSQVTRRLSIEPNLQCRHSSGSPFAMTPRVTTNLSHTGRTGPDDPTYTLRSHLCNFQSLLSGRLPACIARCAVICGHIASPESRTRLIRSLNMVFRQGFPTIRESTSTIRLLPVLANWICLFMRPSLMSARMFAVLCPRYEEGNKQEQHQAYDTGQRIGSEQA